MDDAHYVHDDVPSDYPSQQMCSHKGKFCVFVFLFILIHVTHFFVSQCCVICFNGQSDACNNAQYVTSYGNFEKVPLFRKTLLTLFSYSDTVARACLEWLQCNTALHILRLFLSNGCGTNSVLVIFITTGGEGPTHNLSAPAET
jgi:hypothetical protein